MAPESQTTVIQVDQVSLAKAYLSVQACANKKAETIRILDLRELSSFTDYFLICSGMSVPQVKAIADSIVIELKEDGYMPISVEGYGEGRWVIVDFGDMVVHVFLDALRDYYDLEALWHEGKKVPIPQELYITSVQH
jgi:ribosome-associated protein